MAKDDYLLDQIERSQEHQSRRRRDNRSRRRRVFAFISLVLVALFILSAPSLLSHSPIGRSMVTRTAAGYGLDAQVKSVRVGWITPLRVTGLTLRGESAGSEITIDQVDTGMTVRDLVSHGAVNFGEVVVRTIDVKCSVANGRCSLEDDFAAFLAPSDDPSALGTIDVQQASIAVTDAATGATWFVSQANANVDLEPTVTRVAFAGVVTEPNGGGGGIQGGAELASGASSAVQPKWQMTLEAESLPLSVVTLVNRRFPAETGSMPQNVSGDATGSIRATGLHDGTIDASIQALQIRNLRATEPGPNARVWTNALATVDGDVKLVGSRVIGNRLTAQADFASATLNGSFSSSTTLIGENDNPLQWLEALDGTAQAEIDLVLFDQALPGLLPLRDGAQLISGRATAKIESLPSNRGRRSKLTIQSEALRARARGRAVVIEPIEIHTTVLDDNGNVRAEQFKLTSSFASAVGQGDLQSGDVDFQIDFGRLSSMLRPIVDLSKTSMGGSARGSLRWSATEQSLWQLTGNANATNLLVTLASGQSFKRQSLQADVEALGRWGGQSLDELTRAKVTVKSSGLNLGAELTAAVRNPSSTTPFPIRVDGSGRIETLTETIGPWLPAELHDAEGGFELHARGEASSIAGRLGDTTIDLTNPRIAYGNRWFSQPSIKVDFKGDYAWPSGDFRSRSLTVAGDAVSMALKGESTAEFTDVEVAWRAKLERIQGSVRKRVADDQRWPTSNAQTVGFRPANARQSVETDDWLVMGDCDGNFTMKTNSGVLDITSDSTGKNIAIVQPPDASAQSYTVGPMPRQATTYRNGASAASRIVWSEPNLRVKGLTRYEPKTGRILADGMQIAGDWFATTLTGHALWNEKIGDVEMKGPARFKMDEISRRLTTLTGTSINVQGIQETPLKINATRGADNNVAFAVAGNLGWDMGEIAGVKFGGATVPVRLTETTVEISPAVIPVGQGEVNLAGEVFYRPGPIWLRAQPGMVARNLRLTPDMTNRWLKYLAPLAADAARIDGTMSVELDEAIVVVDTPEQSRVRGRLNIESAQMTAGPLATQIIGGVDQLKAIARASALPEARNDTTLITMRPQTIDFTLDRGVVSHQRLYFDIDRVEIMTSGQVALDTRVNMVAQLPLDERWLGSDLQSLAGQNVTLPINGTLSRPKLDAAGIREVVMQLGTQAAQSAVQETAENYLQKQLNRGIDKIFGR